MVNSVLVVEDEFLIAGLLQNMLEDLGYTNITLASDVAGACEALEATKPELVILDLNLAGQSARPIAQKLRAVNVPFVISSGYDAQALDEEWRGYPILTKPYGAEDLQARILQALALEKI
jgi:DNA-binding response OmpR family regulator